ncbi:hypothetical protein BH11PLA2_BH11PLA2_09410 [soil metagenome]
MGTTLVLMLALTPGVDVFGGAKKDPLGPKAYPPIYIPVDAPTGYLYQPAVDLNPVPRLPECRYKPHAGDLLLLSDPDPLFNVLYVIARSGKPGHCAVVVTMPDGNLGVLESGFSFTPWTRVTPIDYWLNLYAGHIWVRQRETPLTPEQDRRLTEFAMLADGGQYAKPKFALQLTLLRARNPILTRFVGKPVGPGHKYVCVQIVVEALVYAGLTDAKTARPSATYAQDLFYDRSRNPYIDRHPPLACGGWSGPQLWTAIAGTALLGSSRPKPPASAWPSAGGAHLVIPIPNGDQQAPTPTIVGHIPGDTSLLLATVEAKSARIGYLDRPYRLFSRK